jgi:geranylgeranyl reductase family protein
MSDYDVLVVGAGPSGSTFARYMAENGYKVGVLEKKKEVGLPLQCAGLLGKKIKNLNLLPEEFILNEVNGAYLHSPSNHMMHVSKKDTQAYVLDRVGYDNYLAEIASVEGAEILLKHNVESINSEKGTVKMSNQGQKVLSAKVIVGADGHSSLVSNSFNKKSSTFKASQYLVETSNPLDTDSVNLHVKSELSPGFIWSIPLAKNQARIGLFGDHDYQSLKRILSNFMQSQNYLNDIKILKKYHGEIPVFDSKKSLVNEKTILLGDAASQVKPTTGGGLLIGFACAKIAADVVTKALDNDKTSILQEYETQYRKKFEKELKTQLMVQKTFEMLSDQDLDEMFIKLKEKGAEDIISTYGDMDSQSPLVKELLKRGLIFSVLPKVLYRSVSQIWKFF